MDVEASPGSYLKLFSNIQNQTSVLKPKFKCVTNEPVEYIVNIVQPDETFQTLELTKNQAESLGLVSVDVSDNVNTLVKTSLNDVSLPINNETYLKPLGSCENPIEIIKNGDKLHTTQNLSADDLQQIANALQYESVVVEQKHGVDDNTSTFYRVVYPDELNLVPPKPTKRGRPKRKVKEEDSEDEDELMPVKNVRTRCGRITRLPKHIKKDFRLIESSEVNAIENIAKNSVVQPVKTDLNNSVEVNPLDCERRKRSIAPQFLCPKCQKAYLGRNKMKQHLRKYPDHGPIPESFKIKHDDTWNYLINLCNKGPEGQRGLKFCKELVNFIENLRLLAKLFFKHPTELDKDLYFVDKNLSETLGIDSGNYVLNENELFKEIKPVSTETKVKVNGDAKAKPFDLNVSPEEKRQLDSDVVEENKPLYGLNLDFNQKDNCFEEQGGMQCNSSNSINTEITLNGDLLSHNMLLNSLPNLHNTVDLILNNVDNAQEGFSENTTNHDEVMNVDQFVNERLKNFTNVDLELPNSTLDLPGLELFQFNTS